MAQYRLPQPDQLNLIVLRWRSPLLNRLKVIQYKKEVAGGRFNRNLFINSRSRCITIVPGPPLAAGPLWKKTGRKKDEAKKTRGIF
ncbi:hypothetical protein GWI33_008540 [Rhynchophorus ferrugineus]|uniref:Uncharacterized protein n=1 Tax=Rhynchophorus ferrugineus TaxID=354439 RepID=A0A834MH98_RHYFE|nr:hypothetical protein GWI33_008540 [Rhynchophorus ferrugineus]